MSVASLNRSRQLRLAQRSNSYRERSGRGAGRVLSAMKGVLAVAVGVTLLASLSLGLLAGYRYLTFSDSFALRDIEIRGNSHLEYGDILGFAGVSMGRNVLDLNMGEIRSNLERNPWIESVAVRRVLPSGLVITVTERQPWFWVRKDNGLFYADAEGRLIERVGPEKFASLPLLVAKEGAEAFVEELPAFVSLLRDNQLVVGQQQIAWIRADARKGLCIGLRNNGPVLEAGLEHWRRELGAVCAVWADLKRRGELTSAVRLRARGDKVWVAFEKIS